MDCSLPGSSDHGIFQARVLEWGAIVSSVCPPEQHSISPHPAPPMRKLPWASYSHPSKGRQNENHNYRKLTKLFTWITALSNSMKLWAMPHMAKQDGQVMVESSDKTWSTRKRNDKPLQYSCLENTMNSMKSKKIWHWKMNFPGWWVHNMLMEKIREIAPKGLERLSQSRGNA